MATIIKDNKQATVGAKKYSDQYSGLLKETFEFFQESNVQMISGFSEILGEEGLFESYKEKLSENMSPDEEELLNQLMDNNRIELLRESTLTGLSPIIGLSMPTVRKMWLRTCMKNAIPTEVAKVPTFAISYMLPYMQDMKGKKYYLPEALRNPDNELAEKARLTTDWINVVTEDINILALSNADNGTSFESPYAQVNTNHVDPRFYIDSVKLTVNNQDYTVKASLKSNPSGKIYGQVTVRLQDGTDYVETIFGSMEFITGKLQLTSMKQSLKAFTVMGWYSSENNMHSTSVGFEIQKKDINIGTGTHINAALPIESIQDTMALYNIDATVETVDIMSNIVAQKLDQEIRRFLEEDYELSGQPFRGQFSIKPAAGFAGTPTEWRRELRTVIDWWATKLKQSTAFSKGYFVIVGNRLDTNLLPDVNWQFRSVNAERSGVDVDYDLGAVTYSNSFQIVASDLIKQGSLRMFWVPTENDKMTYKYYRATRCA